MMKLRNALLSALAASAIAVAPAAAQTFSASDWAAWQKANSSSVSAENMMSGDVTNGFNMLGNVDDLVLNTAGTQIEYVLYEVPFPYSQFGNDTGFVKWDNIAVERGVASGLDLRIDDEASKHSKQELKLTRSQAKNRLVSNLIGSELLFADGQTREITDLLFDPQTGALTNAVVEMNKESLFKDDERIVPASLISIDANRMVVSQPVTYNYVIWYY